jgi:pimeloyl-ACP methyl ester carboxylesterase
MKQSINLFIGGAGDFERFYVYGPRNFILKDVKIPFEKIIEAQKISNYQSQYLSYKDLKRDRIWNLLPNPEACTINLIGYSFGGWNAAHFSKVLADKQYEVNLLITLDPVGVNAQTVFKSDLFFGAPQPIAKQWINITSISKKWCIDNFIAKIGGRWIPNLQSNVVLHETLATHVEVGKMFFNPRLNNHTNLSDELLKCIEGN